MSPSSLSRRAYHEATSVESWEEIWEAGPYFDRISALLENAQDFAIFVGWQIDSRLRLKNPNTGILEPLREKVIRLCEEKPKFKVYFLLWDHAYFYVLERETWQGRIWEDVHPHIYFVFDNRHCLGGAHHEKIAVIDGQTAFCGGIDLCDGRWDSVLHSYWDVCRSLDFKKETHGPYHDLAVQVSGTVCHGIQNHIARRWKALSSIPFPEPLSRKSEKEGAKNSTVYLSRTLVELDRDERGSALVREVEFLFRDLIRSAEKRIILEGQYYWSKVLNDLLISKIKEMKGSDFEIYLILSDLRFVKSFSKRMMPYECELLAELQASAEEAQIKLILGFPWVSPPSGTQGLLPKPIYVHSKVIVIDDRYLGIGSANLSTRALRIDTEIQLTLEGKTMAERSHIAEVAKFILSHWQLLSSDSSEIQPALKVAAPSCKKNGRIFFHKFKLQDFSKLKSSFPWVLLFDPVLPWFYRFKRKYRGFIRRRWYPLVYTLVLIWVFGIVFAGLMIAVPWSSGGFGSWPIVYLALLSSVWLSPVPFVFVQMVMVFHLGYFQAVKIGVASLWVSSFIGYWVARSFPIYSFKYYSVLGPAWVPERFGLRSFPVLLSVLLDPRVSLRSKIAYQGIYCIPLPWFALGTGILLPAFLYVFARFESYFLSRLTRVRFSGCLDIQIAFVLGVICLISFIQLGVKLWAKKRT